MMILRYESVIFGAAVHPPQIQPQKIGLGDSHIQNLEYHAIPTSG